MLAMINISKSLKAMFTNQKMICPKILPMICSKTFKNFSQDFISRLVPEILEVVSQKHWRSNAQQCFQ